MKLYAITFKHFYCGITKEFINANNKTEAKAKFKELYSSKIISIDEVTD